MKRVTIFVFAAAALAFCVLTAAAAQEDPLASVPRISQEDFRQLLASGRVLAIDVRDEGQYENGHIPGAVSMPLLDLSKHVARLKTEKRPIVTYCA